jgi:hypothetical protein
LITMRFITENHVSVLKVGQVLSVIKK